MLENKALKSWAEPPHMYTRIMQNIPLGPNTYTQRIHAQANSQSKLSENTNTSSFFPMLCASKAQKVVMPLLKAEALVPLSSVHQRSQCTSKSANTTASEPSVAQTTPLLPLSSSSAARACLLLPGPPRKLCNCSHFSPCPLSLRTVAFSNHQLDHIICFKTRQHRPTSRGIIQIFTLAWQVLCHML